MDHFVRYDNKIYAGRHLIVEAYDAQDLNDVDHVRKTLIEMALQIKATILGELFHAFPGGGVTGVVVLAESHISIHTWPETGYAAIDIFTCGSCDPYDGLVAMKNGLSPQSVVVQEFYRG